MCYRREERIGESIGCVPEELSLESAFEVVNIEDGFKQWDEGLVQRPEFGVEEGWIIYKQGEKIRQREVSSSTNDVREVRSTGSKKHKRTQLQAAQCAHTTQCGPITFSEHIFINTTFKTRSFQPKLEQWGLGAWLTARADAVELAVEHHDRLAC